MQEPADHLLILFSFSLHNRASVRASEVVGDRVGPDDGAVVVGEAYRLWRPTRRPLLSRRVQRMWQTSHFLTGQEETQLHQVTLLSPVCDNKN